MSTISIRKITKGNNSAKNAGGATVVNLCTSYDHAFYFIPSSESSAYLKQIKCILSAVKKYRIFSLVTDTNFIFSL